MQNGKGDKPRPIKNLNQYCNNWDEIDWSVKTNTQKTLKKNISKKIFYREKATTPNK